jgi:hypothetical protein
MGDSIPVTIELRPTEQRQLDSFVDQLRADFQQAELDDRVEVLNEIDITVDGWEGTADADDWQFLISNLSRLKRHGDVCRIEHIQWKLMQRLEPALDELDNDGDSE